jgi:hypothetical protein
MGHWYGDIVLPTGGRRGRYELLKWLAAEQSYIDDKFGSQPGGLPSHTGVMKDYDLPRRQVEQYLDRAVEFMRGAAEARAAAEAHRELGGDALGARRDRDARILEAKAQQAIGKCITTLMDVGESAIEAWGVMPRPAVPSGTVELDVE